MEKGVTTGDDIMHLTSSSAKTNLRFGSSSHNSNPMCKVEQQLLNEKAEENILITQHAETLHPLCTEDDISTSQSSILPISNDTAMINMDNQFVSSHNQLVTSDTLFSQENIPVSSENQLMDIMETSDSGQIMRLQQGEEQLQFVKVTNEAGEEHILQLTVVDQSQLFQLADQVQSNCDINETQLAEILPEQADTAIPGEDTHVSSVVEPSVTVPSIIDTSSIRCSGAIHKEHDNEDLDQEDSKIITVIKKERDFESLERDTGSPEYANESAGAQSQLRIVRLLRRDNGQLVETEVALDNPTSMSPNSEPVVTNSAVPTSGISINENISVVTTSPTNASSTMVTQTNTTLSSHDLAKPVVDTTAPIALEEGTIVKLGGQDCEIRKDPETGALNAYPIKPTVVKRSRGRPRKRERPHPDKSPPALSSTEETDGKGQRKGRKSALNSEAAENKAVEGLLGLSNPGPDGRRKSMRSRKKPSVLVKDYHVESVGDSSGDDKNDDNDSDDDVTVTGHKQPREKRGRGQPPVISYNPTQPKTNLQNFLARLGFPVKRGRGRPRRTPLTKTSHPATFVIPASAGKGETVIFAPQAPNSIKNRVVRIMPKTNPGNFDDINNSLENADVTRTDEQQMPIVIQYKNKLSSEPMKSEDERTKDVSKIIEASKPSNDDNVQVGTSKDGTLTVLYNKQSSELPSSQPVMLPTKLATTSTSADNLIYRNVSNNITSQAGIDSNARIVSRNGHSNTDHTQISLTANKLSHQIVSGPVISWHTLVNSVNTQAKSVVILRGTNALNNNANAPDFKSIQNLEQFQDIFNSEQSKSASENTPSIMNSSSSLSLSNTVVPERMTDNFSNNGRILLNKDEVLRNDVDENAPNNIKLQQTLPLRILQSAKPMLSSLVTSTDSKKSISVGGKLFQLQKGTRIFKALSSSQKENELQTTEQPAKVDKPPDTTVEELDHENFNLSNLKGEKKFEVIKKDGTYRLQMTITNNHEKSVPGLNSLGPNTNGNRVLWQKDLPGGGKLIRIGTSPQKMNHKESATFQESNNDVTSCHERKPTATEIASSADLNIVATVREDAVVTDSGSRENPDDVVINTSVPCADVCSTFVNAQHLDTDGSSVDKKKLLENDIQNPGFILLQSEQDNDCIKLVPLPESNDNPEQESTIRNTVDAADEIHVKRELDDDVNKSPKDNSSFHIIQETSDGIHILQETIKDTEVTHENDITIELIQENNETNNLAQDASHVNFVVQTESGDLETLESSRIVQTKTVQENAESNFALQGATEYNRVLSGASEIGQTLPETNQSSQDASFQDATSQCETVIDSEQTQKHYEIFKSSTNTTSQQPVTQNLRTSEHDNKETCENVTFAKSETVPRIVFRSPTDKLPVQLLNKDQITEIQKLGHVVLQSTSQKTSATDEDNNAPQNDGMQFLQVLVSKEPSTSSVPQKIGLKTTEDELENFKCVKCGHQSYFREQFIAHIGKHTDVETQKCKCCSFRCFEKAELVSHFKKTHPKNICAKCDFMAEHKYVIRRHMQRHDPDSCTCDICGKKYKDQYILKMHVQCVHMPPEVLFECEVCCKKFTRKAHLKRHLRIHDAEKPFKCPHCDYRGCERSDVTKHILIHEEPRHVCNVCGKAFRHLKNKELHLKRHRGERDYKCGVCDFYGYTFTDIRKHIERKHADHRAILCNKCGSSFRSEQQLKDHLPVCGVGSESLIELPETHQLEVPDEYSVAATQIDNPESMIDEGSSSSHVSNATNIVSNAFYSDLTSLASTSVTSTTNEHIVQGHAIDMTQLQGHVINIGEEVQFLNATDMKMEQLINDSESITVGEQFVTSGEGVIVEEMDMEISNDDGNMVTAFVNIAEEAMKQENAKALEIGVSS